MPNTVTLNEHQAPALAKLLAEHEPAHRMTIWESDRQAVEVKLYRRWIGSYLVHVRIGPRGGVRHLSERGPVSAA